jgi:hypothetical protein
VSGPTSYVNTGTFTTAGQVINASDFGLGGIESIQPMGLTNDSVYTVLIALTPQSANSGASKQATIHWFVQATGAEVANAVDLSASFIRLRIRGV